MACTYTGAIVHATVTGGTGAITSLSVCDWDGSISSISTNSGDGSIEHWACCQDDTDPPPSDGSARHGMWRYFFSHGDHRILGGSLGFGGGGAMVSTGLPIEHAINPGIARPTRPVGSITVETGHGYQFNDGGNSAYLTLM